MIEAMRPAAPRPRISYQEAVARAGILHALRDFDPHIAGTPPLGLEVASSDIDILCHAPDPEVFAELAWVAFSDFPAFTMHQWLGKTRPVVVGFEVAGWPFGIFGDPRPVREQEAWLHLEIEGRLLEHAGDYLKKAVMRLRRSGMKTEPAFAAVLGLGGDPFEAVLALGRAKDEDLEVILRDAIRNPRL